MLITFRKATAYFRLLPDFLIIGAQKSGTSTMHSLLAMHPCVRSCIVKEPSFFDIKFERGLKWYRLHFPTIFSKVLHRLIYDSRFLVFESTVSYLYHPHAIRRIAKCLPRVKIIVMLRNPVDRAYSEFWYRKNVWHDNEFSTFEDAINYELKTKVGEFEYYKLLKDEAYSYHRLYRYSYLLRGTYAFQIENLYKFIPKECVLIIRSEDFFKDWVTEYTKVLNFLKLRKWFPETLKIKKKGKYPEMRAEIRSLLNQFFLPYNEKLYSMLGVTYDWS